MAIPETDATGDHVDLAGYLLDSLGPAERAEVERHLAGCAACRAEAESLHVWTEALAAVPEAMTLDGPPEGGDLLLQRTLRQVRSESSGRVRRRTALVSAAAAVVAAAVIAGGVAPGRATPPGRPPGQAPAAPPAATLAAGRATAPDVPRAQAPAASAAVTVPAGTRTGTSVDPVTGARITAAVIPATGWVRVTAAVSGIPAGEKCLLQVVGADGMPVLAGSWMVSPEGARAGTTLNGSALIDPADVRSVRVVTTAGEVYASVTV